MLTTTDDVNRQELSNAVSRSENKLDEIPKGPNFGMRHVQALLLFMNAAVFYISRLNIGVSVVAMTNAATTNPDFPEFNWNEKEISYIFASFYWGYAITQFPAGILCRNYGVKIILGIATCGSMVMCATTPWLVTWGSWQSFCGVRFGLGLFQGLLFPCIHQHLAKWSPVQERSRLGAFSYTGFDFGTVVSMGLTGLIAASPLGWPGISYVSAGFCLVACILWFIYAADQPNQSRFITETEKEYIELSMRQHGNSEVDHKEIPIPWKAILTSMPVMTLLLTRGAGGYSLTTLHTQNPLYFHGILNMEIKSNALFSALPFVVTWAMAYVFVVLSHILQNKIGLSLLAVRKILNTIAFWIPAGGLIAIGYFDIDTKSWAIAAITISVGVHSANVIGSALNTIDLSPNHAGIIMSICNMLSNFVSMMAPLVAGAIVKDNSSRSQWQLVFAIAAAVFFFGNLIFIVFGSTEKQPWDSPDFLKPKDIEISKRSGRCCEFKAEAEKCDKCCQITDFS